MHEINNIKFGFNWHKCIILVLTVLHQRLLLIAQNKHLVQSVSSEYLKENGRKTVSFDEER
jgi:hypothetical protein